MGQLVKLGTGEVFPLGFEPVTIGRHADNDVILSDQQVSRHHAEIAMQGGRWVIRDLGSANGTYVNGQRIERPRVLNPGDMVRLGQATFRVELPVRIAEQDTLVERRREYVPTAATPPARSSTPWLGLALFLAALMAAAAILLGMLVIWPRIQGDFLGPRPGEGDVVQTTVVTEATPTVVSEATTEPTAAPVDSPVPPKPSDTAVPTVAPPTAAPLPTPTVPPPTPTGALPPRPVIGYFLADRTTITQGECARLEWGLVENASSVTLSDVGPVNSTGRLDVCLNATKSFTLQAKGPGGTAEKSLRITVQAPVGPVIEYFRVVPSMILPGDCALLEWGKVDNATSAGIEPGIGGVGTPGSLEVCPGGTTTYVLTAQNASETTTAETTLIVSSGTDQRPVIPFFTANPSSIRAGECTLLNWGKVEYATSVTIDNGIGGVATPDSKEICPGATTTFIMTAVGPGGTTDYHLTVSVSPGRQANLPDLVIESIQFAPNPCYRGQTCKVRVKVRNDGPVEAGHFVLRWAPVGEEVVPVEWDVDRLGIDEERRLSYNWIPNRADDNWRTMATVDVYDEVGEIEEGAANYLEQFITVLEP